MGDSNCSKLFSLEVQSQSPPYCSSVRGNAEHPEILTLGRLVIKLETLLLNVIEVMLLVFVNNL